jgi:hypothetical protein
MGDLYRRLLDGPLRPDTLDATTIEATGTAELADGRAADAFTVSVPGPAVPLWQLYYLAPRAEFDPSDLPSTLVYEVYLGEDVEVVVGVSDVGGIPQLVRHELELLPAPVIVRLPEPGAADTGPVDG